MIFFHSFILTLAELIFSPGVKAQSANSLVSSWGFLVNETTNADGIKIIPTDYSQGDYDVRPQRPFLAVHRKPKFASSSRMRGTADKYKAAVQGSISCFGKYSVDENASTINFEIEGSSFPKRDGVTQKRPFSIF
jgi:hypothetical protein